jgi:hypothetical protein
MIEWNVDLFLCKTASARNGKLRSNIPKLRVAQAPDLARRNARKRPESSGERLRLRVKRRRRETRASGGGSPRALGNARPLLLGITKASLSTDSFISAASFLNARGSTPALYARAYALA